MEQEDSSWNRSYKWERHQRIAAANSVKYAAEAQIIFTF